jgi:hypothetical protein
MTAKTVFIGLALVLAGVLLGIYVPIAEAQRTGRYAIASSHIGQAWRVNVATGKVSFCFTLSPGLMATCSPWGPVDR